MVGCSNADRLRWKAHFDVLSFRKHYQAAMEYFVVSGETGNALRASLAIGWRRMDQNHDGVVSDQEILSFLAEKENRFRI
jgi:hypothetical protein